MDNEDLFIIAGIMLHRAQQYDPLTKLEMLQLALMLTNIANNVGPFSSIPSFFLNTQVESLCD